MDKHSFIKTVANISENIIDKVIGDTLDWRTLVRKYPKASMIISFTGGVYLGYLKGKEISETVKKKINDKVVETQKILYSELQQRIPR